MTSVLQLRAARRPFLLIVLAVCLARTAAATNLYPLVPIYTPTDVPGNAQFPARGHRGFTSHDGILIIRDGLPVGATIIGTIAFDDIYIITESPGGPLGGEITDAGATLRLEMRGTGILGGYSRTITMPVTMRFHTGPQATGANVQSFALDLAQAQGQIVADVDFDLLRLSAGTNFGLPSPGKAVLTRDGTGDYLVDSFFDITYRVDFVGHPGGTFSGLSGSTTSEHRQRAGVLTNPPCGVPDNGLGTAEWTPFCGGWLGKTEGMIYDGGAGTFLIGQMSRKPPGGLGLLAGGPFGGVQTSDIEQLQLDIVGEGALAGFHRVVLFPFTTHHDLGQGMTVVPFQGRISEGSSLVGQLPPGDPDFDLLRVTAGTGFGLASAGHTTLMRGGVPNWLVDSFFDITYRVDFVGHPGSPLGGLSASTLGGARGQAGRERNGFCLVPDQSGTALFPPLNCLSGYRGPRHVRGLLDGLPFGSPVLADIEILPHALIGISPGGPLGGQTQDWDARLIVQLTGAGVYAGYTRLLSILALVQTATAPVVPGSNPQHYETELLTIQGQLPPGDPDFDLFRFTGGTGFGLPSPGYTSLTSAGGSKWNIDSFFDVTYRIDFVASPGGPFAGHSGSTTDRQRFVNGDLPTLAAPLPATPNTIALSLAAPSPTRAGASLTLSLPKRAAVRAVVHDVAGRLVRVLEDGTREAGLQPIAWDGTGASHARVSPGLYLIRVDVDGARYTRRVMVSR